MEFMWLLPWVGGCEGAGRDAGREWVDKVNTFERDETKLL